MLKRAKVPDPYRRAERSASRHWSKYLDGMLHPRWLRHYRRFVNKYFEMMNRKCQHKNVVEAEGTDPNVLFCNDCNEYVKKE